MANLESFYEIPVKSKMSADVENKEEEIQEKKPSVYKRLIAYWQLGFKLVELVSEEDLKEIFKLMLSLKFIIFEIFIL